MHSSLVIAYSDFLIIYHASGEFNNGCDGSGDEGNAEQDSNFFESFHGFKVLMGE